MKITLTNRILDYYNNNQTTIISIKELANLFSISTDTFRRNADKLVKNNKLIKYSLSSYRGSKLIYSRNVLSEKEINSLTYLIKNKAKEELANKIKINKNSSTITSHNKIVPTVSVDINYSENIKENIETMSETKKEDTIEDFDFQAFLDKCSQEVQENKEKFDISSIVIDKLVAPTKILKIGNISMEIPDVSSKYKEIIDRIENTPNKDNLTDAELANIITDNPINSKKYNMTNEEYLKEQMLINENFTEIEIL